MPTLQYDLSSFTNTNADLKAGATFSAYASGTPVYNASISSATLYLSQLKTYSGYGYLTFSLGGGSATTAGISSNSNVHGETLTLTAFDNGLLTAGSGTVYFTLRRTNSGTGNLLNIRTGLYGTLTLDYSLNYTACTAPTACSVSPTLSESTATLSFSGASGGVANGITGYEIQYSDSANNASWGAWTELTAITTTATSGTLTVSAPATRGYYRRFQVRTRGAAGASYYSGWRVSTNSLRRNTLPDAPTSFSASPASYSTETVTLAWSGALGGTSAIKGYVISGRMSTDNATWSPWSVLTTLNLTAGSGTYTPQVSRVVGTYTQFSIVTRDVMNVDSPAKLSASILCTITACVPPTTVSLSAALAETAVMLSWGGAASGSGNAISAYEIQYADSANNTAWGTWTALSTVSSTATSGSLSVNPPTTAGHYRRFQIRVRGAAGENYYSAWKVSANTLLRNIPPTAPSNFSAAPAVYEQPSVSIVWSGGTAGTSAIRSTLLQVSTSQDGNTWTAYESIATITGSGGQGSYAYQASTAQGLRTRFRLALTDTLNALSTYVVSNIIRKNSPPAAPVVLSPKEGSVCYGAAPFFLVRMGADAEGQRQKLCVKVDAQPEVDTVQHPSLFSSSGFLSAGGQTIFLGSGLSPGEHTVRFSARDEGLNAEGAAITRRFTIRASPFEDITANLTHVKAAHITALRLAANALRAFYGLAPYVWQESIIPGKTEIKNWPFHIAEIRRTLEQIVNTIRDFDPAMSDRLPQTEWLPLGGGRPRADVMAQLHALLLTL